MSTLTATSDTFSTDVGDAYTVLEAKVLGTLNTEYDANRLTGDAYAKTVASVIPALLQSAIQTAYKQHTVDEEEELLAKQVEEMEKKVCIAEATCELTLAQAETERQKTDMVIAQKNQVIDTTEEQVPLLVAQRELAETQARELISSVIFNNKIKSLDAYSDMIGTLGAGSLAISTDMWTAFFDMVADIYNSKETDLTVSVTTAEVTKLQENQTV